MVARERKRKLWLDTFQRIGGVQMSAQGTRSARETEFRQPTPDAASDPAATASMPVPLIAAAEEELDSSGVSEPTLEEIARLAYSYWEARGCEGGSAEGDWLRAEQELKTR